MPEDALAEGSLEDASFIRPQLRIFDRSEASGCISDIEIDGGAYRATLTTGDGLEFGFMQQDTGHRCLEEHTFHR
jgi:hypothetical protein